ncbi:type VI-B CRISPR-associated RNA-guided ribonuclease Cas13b [Flavobacterium covae]|nr:type VI-B CRISPR-associated RNA-guided ribonuclease Cas13b [Flavobacterium covae]
MNTIKKSKREELIKKGKKLLEENLENAVFNHCLRPFLEENKTDDKQNKTVSLRKYRKSKPNEETSITLTQSGLVFLMSFFLHRKEFQVFTSGLEGFKAKVNTIKEEEISLNKNNIVYMITHWSYSYYNFKGLKHRIKTDQGVSTLEQNNTTHSLTNTNTKEALLTQIVDYLSKVPNEIYETLSEKQQKEFEEDINEYMRENPENEDSTFSSIVSHKVIRKRYENKFNYFAMRFLDEYAELPTLRFRVNFGDYIKDRQKKILESIQFDSERIIKKKSIFLKNWV